MEEARGADLSRGAASSGSAARGIASRAAPILLAIVLALFATALLRQEPESRAWSGYRSILVPLDLPESAYLEALAPLAGLVLSEATALVELSDFHELGARRLSETARLLPRDPRRSAYLESLPAYFRASQGDRELRVLYVKEGLIGPAPESLLDRAGLPYLRPRLRSEPPARLGLAAAILFSALSLALALYLPREGPPILLALLPWLPATIMAPRILPFGLFALAASLRLMPALEAWAEERAFRRSRRRAGLRAPSAVRQRFPRGAWPREAAFGIGLALVFFGLLWTEAAGLLAASLLAASSALLAPGATRLAGALRARFGLRGRGFSPLRIGAPGPPRGVGRRRRASGLLGLLALASVLPFGGFVAFAPDRPGVASPRVAPAGAALAARGGEGVLTMPFPLAEAPARPKLEDLRSGLGARSEPGPRLPGLVEWLAHRAFQEALPLRPLGAAPGDPFEPVTRPLPSGDEELLLEFGQDWLRSALADAPEPSVARLLLDAGVGAARSGSAAGATTRPLATFRGILYIFLLALLLALVLREGNGNRTARERAQPR